MSKINCLNPKIIVNPLAEDYIRQHRHYYAFGRKHFVLRFYSNFFLYKMLPKVTSDNLDTFYVNDGFGRKLNLYLQVGCGHCLLCQEKKANSFVQRCMAETLMYKSRPIFLTLTYDQENLPQEGVSLRDCQLFFKRLRINLSRKGYSPKIRYVLVSEYGKLGRAHYHAILWNLHQSDILSFRDIKQTISHSWNKGFIRLRLVDPNNDKAFRYTAKYLFKDSNVPEGKRSTFMVCSNRNGGIGSSFYRKERSKLFSNHYPRKFLARNPFSRRPFEYFVDSYALNKMIPSLCSSIPVRTPIRRFIVDYVTLLYRPDVSSQQFKPFLDSIYSTYSDYFYLLSLDDAHYVPGDNRPSLTIINEMLSDMQKISSDMRRNESERQVALKYQFFRNQYFTDLLQNPVEYNTSLRYYRFRRMRQFALERQVL